MAEWKKVIVSGSHAHLASVTASNLTDDRLVYSDDGGVLLSTDITVTSNGDLSGVFSGSFSGSAEGDGSGLTGISLDNDLTQGGGIVSFTYNGSSAAAVHVDSGSLAGDGLETNSGAFRVQLSGSSINRDSNGIGVADDGIITSMITDSNVTLAKIQDISDNRVLGRIGVGSAGAPQQVTVLDEDNMSSNSATALATQQSIKAYVDSQVGGATLSITGSTGEHSIDLNDNGLLLSGSDGLRVSGSVDGSSDVTMEVKIDDGGIANAKLANSTFQVQGGSGLTGGGSATSLGSSDTLAVGAGDGITVNDDDVALNTGSTHFTEGVRAQVSAVDTTGAAGIDMSYDSSNGQFSGSLVNSAVHIGDTSIALGATGSSIDALTLTNSVGSGSFSGSFEGDGSGLTGLATNLQVSSSANNGLSAVVDSIDLKTEGLLFAGTANEVTVQAAATSEGNTVTIGLPDDVTIAGNLTVLGTRTELAVEDLVVEDQFIYLASGSTGATDGGIIVEGASDSDGKGFGWDQSNSRWGFDSAMASGSNSIAPTAFASAVVTVAANTSSYEYKGNIYVDSDDDIYIYA